MLAFCGAYILNPKAKIGPLPRLPTWRRKLSLLLLVGMVLGLAGYLRITAINDSLVEAPYRADAAEYYNYAYNLRHYGVYSRAFPGFTGAATQLVPDAWRTPAYPLFLAPFADGPPSRIVIRHIAYAQAGLGVLTVLLVFLIVNQLGIPWLALAAAALTAMSPQLVNATIYMLSETLFTFLLTLTLYLLCLSFKKTRWSYWMLLLAGLAAGTAALTREVLEYFIPCVIILMLLGLPRPRAWKASAMLLLGALLVWGPWVGRNYADLGTSGDDLQLRYALHQGMYPDMMYQDDPRSYAFPYNFDPNFLKDNISVKSVLTAIWHQFEQDPAKELYWYAIGKPLHLWSWDTEWGQGDVFTYPTLLSPYEYKPLFLVTHALMRGLQWPLVILAFFGCIYVFLPTARRRFDGPALLSLRAISLLFFNVTGVLLLSPPFVRYSIPLIPVVFVTAVVYSFVLYGHAQQIRKLSRPKPERPG